MRFTKLTQTNPRLDSTPLVSVIMGVRNASDSVACSALSILNQTYQQVELLVIDDGSTDSSGPILEHIAENDGRMRVIHQSHQGLTRSLMQAADLASGKYIARQDADDRSLPQRIEKQVTALERDKNAVLATCWVEDTTETGVICTTHTEQSHAVKLNNGVDFILPGIPAHGSVMMRKDAFLQCGGYRACFYYAQDSDLWLRLSQQGPFVTVPEVLYQRTVSTSSISSRYPNAQRMFCELAQESFRRGLGGQNDTEIIEAAEQLSAECRERKDIPTSRRNEATSLMLLAVALSEKEPGLATRYFRDALKKDPTHFRAWKGLFVHSFRRFMDRGA